MRGSVMAKVIIIIVIIAVVGMVGFIFLKGSNSNHASQPSSSNSSVPQPSSSDASAAISAAPIKDFAPNLPMSQKTTVLIQTSDSSDIKYIVPKGQVGTYVKSLPPGYHVVSSTP